MQARNQPHRHRILERPVDPTEIQDAGRASRRVVDIPHRLEGHPHEQAEPLPFRLDEELDDDVCREIVCRDRGHAHPRAHAHDREDAEELQRTRRHTGASSPW